ncbi:MAG: hypothetical protein AAGH83_02285 [Pseudomonadota bacterium]
MPQINRNATLNEDLLPVFNLLLEQQQRTHHELDHNWRQQLLVVLVAVAVLSGLDSSIARILGFDPGDQSEHFGIVVRFGVALYGFFLFFRFGPIMGRFRDQRLALELMVKEVFPYSPATDMRGKYGSDLVQTTSHFEYLLIPNSGRGAETIVIVATCAVFACNHTLGAVLGIQALYGLSCSEWISITFGAALVVFTAILYIGFTFRFIRTYPQSERINRERRQRLSHILKLICGMAICSLFMSVVLFLFLFVLAPDGGVKLFQLSAACRDVVPSTTR